jgi:hypothetical protein
MQTCIHTVLNQIIPQRYVFILCFSSQYNFVHIFTAKLLNLAEMMTGEKILNLLQMKLIIT